MYKSVAKSWLDLQCKLIPGVSQGLLALGAPDQGPFEAAACWPAGVQTAPQLAEIAKQMLSRRQVVSGDVQATPGLDQPKASLVGCPIVVDGKLFGCDGIGVGKPDQFTFIPGFQNVTAGCFLAGSVNSPN